MLPLPRASPQSKGVKSNVMPINAYLNGFLRLTSTALPPEWAHR